ncbi:hypothetical protein [Kribbella sp. NPDC051770]|uniref:hypothetical protein n=1 Tax=Kribbella sp. NPDC051770 TaxID=3155413 RepID=UPI00341FABFD
MRSRQRLIVLLALALLPLTGTTATAAPTPTPAYAEPQQAFRTELPGRQAGQRLDPTEAPGTLARRFQEATVPLTLRHLDRTGALASGARTTVAALDGTVNGAVDVGTGEVTVDLPPGRYVVVSFVPTGTTTSILVQPLLDLTAATTLALDARRARPFGVQIEDRAVASSMAALYFTRRADDGSALWFDYPADRLGSLYAAQLGPAVATGEVTSSLMTQWAVPGSTGDFAQTPVTYTTMDTVRGAFFTGLDRLVQPRSLVPFESRLSTTGPGNTTSKSTTVLAPEMRGHWSKGFAGTGHRTVTEYVEPGAEVLEQFQERDGAGMDSALVTAQNGTISRTAEPGRRYVTRWNNAVLAPSVPEGSAVRYGNLFSARFGLYDDAAGHSGWGMDTEAATRLYRDGRLVAETTSPGNIGRGVEVEPGRASYRLESEVVRNAAARRSTQVKAVWTFDSDTASEEGENLPLWSIGYQPAVDAANDVRRTPVTRLPFTVTAQPGATVGNLGEPVVELSGDQGRTWRRATVVTQRNGFLAIAATPPGAAISLRAKATDSAGNAVEVTVLDAYGLR